MKKILLLAVTLLFAACAEEPVRNYPVAAVQAPPRADLISVRGTVESVESRNVYGTQAFTVERLHVTEGDRVTEGQVLAVLDTEDLQLSIAQQRASLNQARQNSQNMLQETNRMLSEASANLANNTNMHILSAEASLSAAESGVQAAQQAYDNAVSDYNAGINPQVVGAESFMRTARLERDRIETNHANIVSLRNAGVATAEELRQSETALTHARNQYNDAQISYQNARDFQQRTIEQLRTALQSANTARRNAQELLSAARVAAQQDIERLRANVASAEIGANLEPMEIALQLMERQLEEATIKAPISGTVTNVVAREGAMGMGLLFVIDDTEHLRIITTFREYDVARIEQGMAVTITSDVMGGREYTGVISRINPAAVLHSPVVEFEAEVLVTSEGADLRIGMSARVEVVGG